MKYIDIRLDCGKLSEGQMVLLASHLSNIGHEVVRAKEKHPVENPSRHHGLAVLEEEVHELRMDVYADRIPEGRKEAVQVAAMAVRFLMETPVR